MPGEIQEESVADFLRTYFGFKSEFSSALTPEKNEM